jgi:type IV pilus assembly protein PilW
MAILGRRQSGVSLVELMIALLIGLVVTGGLVSVLTATRQAFTIQQGNNGNQENSRFANARLAWSLRMADFWGGIKPAAITTTTNVTTLGGSGDCTGAWVVSVGSGLQNGLRGYNGGTTFPIKDCVPAANYVQNSDVVVMRYADTTAYDPAKGSSTAAFDSTAAGVVPNRTSVFILSAVEQTGTVFRNGEAVPSNPLGSTSGRYVYPFQFEMYYLRPCSDPGADGVCGTTDDGDDKSNPQPSLVRMRMGTNGALISETVIEGIEQMQFEYAAAGGQFLRAGSVTDFNAVTQVRVGLVTRALARDVSQPHAGDFTVLGHCVYSISNTGAVTYGAASSGTNQCTGSPATSYGDKPQQFTRLVSTQVVVLRNRVRG